MYLTSPGHPTDIGLQLGEGVILLAGKGRGGMFFSSPELKAQGELL